MGSLPVGTFAQSAPLSASAQPASAQVERLLNPDGTVSLNTGFGSSLDLRGWNVTPDSKRGPILTRQSGRPDEIAAQPTIVGGSEPRGVQPEILLGGPWSALPHNGFEWSRACSCGREQ